jgi:hypothetical protein
MGGGWMVDGDGWMVAGDGWRVTGGPDSLPIGVPQAQEGPRTV